MKKLFKVVAVAVFSLGLGLAANAQNATSSISANAEVFDEIKVIAEQSLEFGQVMGGYTKTISVTNVASTNQNGNAFAGGEKAGVFSLLARAGSDVTISFDLPEILTGEVDGNTLPISFAADQAAFGKTSTFNYQTQTVFDPNSDYNFGSFPANTISYGKDQTAGSGNGVFIYLGAKVNAAGVASDVYSGTITLTATYN